MPISLLPSLALLLVQSPAATSSPDASTWATCGLEHVFFAGCDVNADHLEDVVIVGGDRKLYVSQNIAGMKANGWRLLRDEALAEGQIGFASDRSTGTQPATSQPTSAASAATTATSLLVLFADRIEVRAAPGFEVARTVAAPQSVKFKEFADVERPVIVSEDGRSWRLAGNAVEPGTDTPPNPPAPWAKLSASPYQPDAPFVRTFFADLSGDGMPDQVGVFRMSRFGGYQELRLLVTPNTATGDSDGDGLGDAEESRLGTNPYDRDTDDDGLLDGWEVNGPPRGISIGEGNKLDPRRQDVIVAVSFYEQVDRAAAEKEMPRVAALYKSLKNKNPDGSTGLDVHFRFEPEKVPPDRQHGGSWSAVGNERLPLRERGILHWMQVTPGGGGQAAQTGDMGGCGLGFAVFAHEFGHQLSLSHTGDSDAAWCPLYPSLMSYAFSYSLGGDPNAIRFSDGRFRDTVLQEAALSERLPYPYDEVKYLAAPPFRFKIEPDGTTGTRIDWNQNGRFDDGSVAADVNYGGSTDCGIRRPMDFTAAAPALAYVGESCWLATLGADQGALSLQRYLGGEKWTDKVAIPNSGTVDDPLLVGTKTHGYAFFRRSAGWHIARFAPPPVSTQPAEATPPAPPVIDAPVHLPQLPRCELSAGIVGGRILLIARHEDDTLETFWLEYADKPVIKPGQKLETRSILPVGFAQNPTDQRVALASAAANSRGAAQCLRLTWCDLAGDRLIERETIWTRGEGSGNGCTSRPVVLFDADGQLNLFHTGGQEGDGSMLVYRTRRIGNQALDDGWLTCLLYDIWTRTRRPVSVAGGPQGAIYAFRWDADGWTKNNTVLLGYNAFGLNAEPMRDFDDGEKISRYGLVHSILWMQPE